ncbi:MAG: Gfo/Idh/MocA family protein [Planctomycetota bacterium]|jgi:predicted dehydrogenase
MTVTVDDPLKVGMIGLRNYAMVRRNLMRDTGCYKMLACYNRSPEPMVECQKTEGAEPTASYEELVNYPGLEAMIISTGAKFHYEQVMMALKKGLHVFVEKPLCSSMGELEEIVALQKETGLVIGVGHEDHYDDIVADYTKNLMESGQMGDVLAFEATTSHSGGHLIKEGDWRGDPEKNPGGMLFQCGVHKLHELMFYFGPISRVQCSMRYDVNKKTGTADSAHCILEFKSGVKGVLNAYHLCGYRHTLDLFGTKASLYRDNRYFDEGITLKKQVLSGSGKKEELEVIDLEGIYQGKNMSPRSMRSFYEAIRQGGQVYPSLADGANAVSVVFAAEESAKTGKAVEVKFFE